MLPNLKLCRNLLSSSGKFMQIRLKTTHFGFRTVEENEKTEMVKDVFKNVATSYDIMNDAMSIGIHRLWKDFFIEKLAPTHGSHFLDMAGGTGDIAFRIVRYLINQNNTHLGTMNKNKSTITIADINQQMLDVGKMRAKR